MRRTFLLVVVIWLSFVGLMSCTRAYDGSNPHQIMQDMLDSYSYMSYAQHEEPFDFHKWTGYEVQWELSCMKLDMLTKVDLIPKKCEGLFLLYCGL